MNFCLNYNSNNKYLKDAEEIKITFKEDNNLKDLRDFLKNNFQDKKIIIKIKTSLLDKNLEGFAQLAKDCPNMVVEIIPKDYRSIPNAEDYIEAGFKFFFETHINSWDLLYGAIEEGASEVIITEELGFSLNKVINVTKPKNIKVRVYPNICQACYMNINPLFTFFIRPEDIILYNDYVDTYDLEYDKNVEGSSIAETLYKIYAIDKKWYGDLQELINGFSISMDNKNIFPIFGKARIRCDKDCLSGKQCNICPQLVEISEKLSKKDETTLIM